MKGDGISSAGIGKGVMKISKIELKPCPFCGRKMVFHKEEFVNRHGKKVTEQYYTHEEKESVCILDEINMPFTIGAGDATENYIGEYPELWNRRA